MTSMRAFSWIESLSRAAWNRPRAIRRFALSRPKELIDLLLG